MSSAATARSEEKQTDRRRHARVAAHGVASHLQTMDANMPWLPVENLSVGGMFVRSATGLAVGTRVMVQLVRPGLRRVIPSLGCVVSVIAPAEAQRMGIVAGMGIRLDPVELEAARRLRDLVGELSAEPSRSSSPVPSTLVDATVPDLSEDVAVPPTRPSAPPPPAEARAEIIVIDPRTPVDTTSADREIRERLIRQLEQEVVVLRRELLRRNRTIGDLSARLSTYEAEADPARARRVDPRAE